MEYPKDHLLGLFFILFINDKPTILKYAVNINHTYMQMIHHLQCMQTIMNY